MLFNVVAGIAKLSLFVVCAYALLGAYARRRRPQWIELLTKRRLTVLGALTLAVGGIKLIEDVVAKESGPVDEAILWFIRDQVPAALNGFFAVVTFSGSARLLMPVAAVAATALLVARRRFEALLVGVSVVMATSDVLAAMCLGAFIPLLISVTKDLSHRNESDIDIATSR